MTTRSASKWIVSGIICVVGWIFKDLALQAWVSLDSRKQDLIISGTTGLAVGIIGSMFASYLYGKIQKDVWKSDIQPLADTLSQMARENEVLLKALVPAIGGHFTESLFAFHPMVSQKIAHILSVETDRAYGRHHKRVIVTTAHDRYTIKELKRIESSAVWLLDFHITWQWLNDSRVTKYPLDDFLLVAAANDEALDDFLSDYQSEGERAEALRRRAKFLEGNIVKSTIVDPFNMMKRISESSMNDVFAIDRVHVTYNGTTTTVKRSELRSIPKRDLPIGVYAAWSLPKSDPKVNPPLPIDSELNVEYVGRMSMAASLYRNGSQAIYGGFMKFPPSDVIANQYGLRLSYPQPIRLDGKAVQLAIDRENSGSRFLHGPLEHQPTPGYSLGLHYEEMIVPGPLTDLHQVSLSWTGGVSG